MNLAVVMPVYNEEANIEKVLNEWLTMLRNQKLSFNIIVCNDGSTDSTLSILESLVTDTKELKIVNKENSGHGQSCLYGYKIALAEGYDWIFQIDSDGQCDPKYFPHFLSCSNEHDVIYGFRTYREDGFVRKIISRVVTILIFFTTYNFVKDANVPYRLMKRDTLQKVIGRIPSDFYLANILLSILQNKHDDIHWVSIGFRKRLGGEPSVKAFKFLKHGIRLFKQLIKVRKVL